MTPETLQPALLPILDTVGALTQQIGSYDRQIERLCQERNPETDRLHHVSGVGPLTALAFVLTLEDPRRFSKSCQVGPALGLVPRRDQSGEQEPQLHMTKTAMPICVNCWSTAPMTSWDPSDSIAAYAAGDCGWPNEAEKTLKRELWNCLRPTPRSGDCD